MNKKFNLSLFVTYGLAFVLLFVFSVPIAEGQIQVDKKVKTFAPTSVLSKKALKDNRNSQNANANHKANICEKLDKISNTIISQRNKWQGIKAEVLNKIKTRSEARKTKILENRARWDANRVQHFDLLEEKAGTDQVKLQAVQDFQRAVEQAIKNRRLATDQAIEEFYLALRKQAERKLIAINSARETFLDSMETALSEARVGCASGGNPVEIRVKLREAFQNAKAKFKEINNQFKKSNKNQVQSQAEPVESDYVSLKNQKIQQAHDAFQQALAVARVNLLSAFGIVKDKKEESQSR